MNETLTAVPVTAKSPDPFEKLEAEPLTAGQLEARICELAGHLAAATCRLLIYVGEFDARRGWAAWEMPSCAAWLGWKCQLAPGTAREHVRVARALRTLPVIRAEFAAARLSYSKVRGLTRIATPATEQDLAQMALPMTAGQLDRFVRAYQSAQPGDDAEEAFERVPARSLRWRFDQDTGGMSFTLQLPPEQGAVLLQALRAAAGDLDHPHDKKPGPVSAQERPEEFKVDAGELADAMTEVAGAYLRGKIVTADNADIYQVIVHTTEDVLAGTVPAQQPADVPAGTPETVDRLTRAITIGHPAWPGRCHVEDGPAVSYGTAQLIACDATISTMAHDLQGQILNVGRRRRKATAAMRRAVRERDGYRCTFPGCESRRVDLHHILWWSNGGETSLENLHPLCKPHHRIVHDKGYIITRRPGGGYTFTRPDGLVIGAPPQLPQPAGDITGTHDATVTPETISAPVFGERLDLHLAIWIALNNGRNPEHGPRPARLHRLPDQHTSPTSQPDQDQQLQAA
jgi:hypothetical protein